MRPTVTSHASLRRRYGRISPQNFSPTSVHERPNTTENRRAPETREQTIQQDRTLAAAGAPSVPIASAISSSLGTVASGDLGPVGSTWRSGCSIAGAVGRVDDVRVDVERSRDARVPELLLRDLHRDADR